VATRGLSPRQQAEGVLGKKINHLKSDVIKVGRRGERQKNLNIICKLGIKGENRQCVVARAATQRDNKKTNGEKSNLLLDGNESPAAKKGG